MANINFDTSVRYLPGVGERRSLLLSKMNISTIRDLLRHFPRAYQNRGYTKKLNEVSNGETASFILTIASNPVTARLKGKKTITKVTAFDDTRKCTITYFNQPYMKGTLLKGTTFRFFGKVTVFNGHIELVSPDYEIYSEEYSLPEFIPLYPLTQGITNKYLIKIINAALNQISDMDSEEIIPQSVRSEAHVAKLSWALEAIHHPENYEMLEKARRRFIFEELFIFALGTKFQRSKIQEKTAPIFTETNIDPFLNVVPFTLTNAQKTAISEISSDLSNPKEIPMHRLLSGDVGSGKTICAAACIYLAVINGYQAAIMAPTSILAVQHYNDLSDLFGKLNIRCELLTGNTTASKKKTIYKDLEDGSLSVIIGTHALLSDNVKFKNPGVFITDEQHRFGVMQRATLNAKSNEMGVHTLVMSATPIPRSLALIMYGDLSLSQINEMPPGRQKVSTFAINESYRDRLNGFIREQAKSGHQTYIVCPAIESNDDEDIEINGKIVDMDFNANNDEQTKLKNAVEYAENLQKNIFPDLKVALIHGKMKPSEKDSVMLDFSNGKIDILVSTTVIEVGVNVPNATLMIVENAERFGLAQLHQLRGRVGRGKDKSWCILISDSTSENAKKRLQIMTETSNGYEIAETDLSIRGPGDYFPSSQGAKQHGLSMFSMASICNNMDDLNLAFRCADELIKNDPNLQNEENKCLLKPLNQLLNTASDTIN